MADYTVEKIESGIATLRYSDGSWAEVVLSSDMTEEDVDDLALQFATKTATYPSFLSAGDSRTAKAKAVPVDDRAEYIIKREAAYGPCTSQLEYITENGLDKWQEKVAQIKTDNPKS